MPRNQKVLSFLKKRFLYIIIIGVYGVKFKLIFIVFNAVILLSFSLIFFMPLFLLDWEYSRIFWQTNWYLPVIFIAIIGILNVYFIRNWRLFTLLEKEDWKGLISYLEGRVYGKNNITSQNVRLLLHAYVVLSDITSMERLEKTVREKNLKVFREQALLFGIPHLLKRVPAEMEEYFRTCLGQDCADQQWLSWNRSFALMLLKRETEAKEILLSLSEGQKDPILLLLASYLLDSFSSRDNQAAEVVKRNRALLRRRYTHQTWEKAVEKAKGNLEVVILIRLVDDAAKWLFEGTE